MKITTTFMAILMCCAVLAFNACDVNNNSKDKTKELLLLGSISSGGVTTYAIGDTGPSGVGKVFYVTDGGLHGLEAAPTDQSTGEAWTTTAYQSVYVNGSSPLPTGIGTGSANTDAIIAQNSGAESAAESCRSYTGGGKKDWFLPSKDEWYQLYLQQTSVGGFADDNYWTSTESDDYDAWMQELGIGIQTHMLKSFTHYSVRAIRAF
jgi:hypothetical protein